MPIEYKSVTKLGIVANSIGWNPESIVTLIIMINFSLILLNRLLADEFNLHIQNHRITRLTIKLDNAKVA